MTDKLKKALMQACKDFGLTEKAIDDLTAIGTAGLTSEATDDDINAKVNFIVPIAKAMQGEITRKSQRKNNVEQSKEITSANEVMNDGNKQTNDGEMPVWFKEYVSKNDAEKKALKEELTAMKAANTQAVRQNAIGAKAKELGIPAYLMKRITISDDADIDAELTSLKQDLVNDNLLPKDAVYENGKAEESLKANVAAMVDALPNA